MSRVQPILPNRHARGLCLDARVLRSCGCAPAISTDDLLEIPSYFLGPATRSIHLFVEKVPWWARLLRPDRVWLLWNHEIVKTYSALAWVSLILCKTEIGLKRAQAEIAVRNLQAEAVMIGFTSWSEENFPRPEVPAALNPGNGFLHVGGQSGFKQTLQVLEAWLQRPDFPVLTVICFWGCRDPIPEELRERTRRAVNIVWHDTPLPSYQLERLMGAHPFHLHTSAAEGFGHSLNRSRATGAVILATDAEPMANFANLKIPSCTEGLWSRCSPADIGSAVERALALSESERALMAAENQDQAAQSHDCFRTRFRQLLRERVGTLEPPPLKAHDSLAREAHFFMGRLPATTGGERYNEVCLQALNEAGCPTTYHWVSPYRAFSLVGLIPHLGDFLCSPFLALFFAWRRGLFLIDEHFLGPFRLTNLIRKTLGLGPLVVVVHHLDHYSSCQACPPSALQQTYHRSLFEPADLVIAVSRFTRDEVRSVGVDEQRIKIVQPGFSPSLKSLRRPSDGPLRCLVLGRCEPRKDWETVLRALARIPPSEVQVNFVGSLESAHFRRVVKPLHRELGLQNRAFFRGQLDTAELQDFFAISDLLIHPSKLEGFGIVLLEAMDWGLPVVATLAASIPELVEDGRDGLLFPPGDEAALARILEELATSPERLQELSNNGKAKSATYTWDRTREGFLAAVSPFLAEPTR